jgi:hypothetical protein
MRSIPSGRRRVLKMCKINYTPRYRDENTIFELNRAADINTLVTLSRQASTVPIPRAGQPTGNFFILQVSISESPTV